MRGDKANRSAAYLAHALPGEENDMRIISDHYSRPISGTVKRVAGNFNLHRSAFDRLLERNGNPVVIEIIEAPPTMVKRIIKVMKRTMRVRLTAWLNLVGEAKHESTAVTWRSRALVSGREPYRAVHAIWNKT